LVIDSSKNSLKGYFSNAHDLFEGVAVVSRAYEIIYFAIHLDIKLRVYSGVLDWLTLLKALVRKRFLEIGWFWHRACSLPDDDADRWCRGDPVTGFRSRLTVPGSNAVPSLG